MIAHGTGLPVTAVLLLIAVFAAFIIRDLVRRDVRMARNHAALREAPDHVLFNGVALLDWLEANGYQDGPDLDQLEEERARRRAARADGKGARW